MRYQRNASGSGQHERQRPQRAADAPAPGPPDVRADARRRTRPRATLPRDAAGRAPRRPPPSIASRPRTPLAASRRGPRGAGLAPAGGASGRAPRSDAEVSRRPARSPGSRRSGSAPASREDREVEAGGEAAPHARTGERPSSRPLPCSRATSSGRTWSSVAGSCQRASVNATPMTSASARRPPPEHDAGTLLRQPLVGLGEFATQVVDRHHAEQHGVTRPSATGHQRPSGRSTAGVGVAPQLPAGGAAPRRPRPPRPARRRRPRSC